MPSALPGVGVGSAASVISHPGEDWNPSSAPPMPTTVVVPAGSGAPAAGPVATMLSANVTVTSGSAVRPVSMELTPPGSTTWVPMRLRSTGASAMTDDARRCTTATALGGGMFTR